MIKLNNSGVEYIDSTHQYFLGDKELRGITQILHKHLFPDMYKGVSQSVLNNAASRGTMVHEQIEVVESLGVRSQFPEVEAYLRLKDEYNVETVACEYIVTDGTGFASGIDLVMHDKSADDTTVEIWDIKTTYSVNKEYVQWQTSIYKKWLEAINPSLKVSKIRCVWLRDDAKRGLIAKVIELGEPIHDSDINELFRCEKEGRLYNKEGKMPSFIADSEEELLEINEKLKALTERKKEIETSIFNGLKESNLDKYKSGNYCYSIVSGYERVTLDTKAFDADDEVEYEKLLKKYPKVTKVAEKLMIR